MSKFKLVFICILFSPVVIFIWWLSKGHFENKYSLLHLLKARWDKESVNQTAFLNLKEDINSDEDLIKKLVKNFSAACAPQRLFLDNRISQEPDFLINYYLHTTIGFPSVFCADRTLVSVNNATLTGIGGIIAFPDCYKASRTIAQARKKIENLSGLLTKKIVLKTLSHQYEICIAPFVGIDGNIETWGGLSALETNLNPSIVNQATVYKTIGINAVFGPNVDEIPVPKAGKVAAKTLSQLEYVRCLSENKILPFMKHFVFPAQARKGNDTHFEVCKIDLEANEMQRFITPYRINEQRLKKPWGIMMGHQVLCSLDPNNSLSLSKKASRFVGNNFLSDPITISDALSMKGILKNGTIKYGKDVIGTVAADLVLVTYFYDYASCVNKIMSADSGDQQAIVLKILNVKYKLGLLKIKQLN